MFSTETNEPGEEDGAGTAGGGAVQPRCMYRHLKAREDEID